MLLDRGKRFADPGSEFTGNLTQGIQDVFFSCRLHLLLIEDVSGAAVLCAQPQYVLASETGNRAIQDGGASGSLADFPGDLRSQPRIRRLAHQTQRLLDTLVGDQAEERRLFQLYRQPLAKRSVKHRVAGRVREIGEDNGVLVRKFWFAVERAGKIEDPRDKGGHNSRGHDRFPPFRDDGSGSSRFSLRMSVRMSEACW